jgi:murein DD-endopeptidase MepM/ murein hydrolase activator NlpD
MNRIVLIVVFLVSHLFALNYTITKQVPCGKTAVLSIKKEQGLVVENVVFHKKIFPFFQTISKKNIYAFIPVSYYEKPGRKRLVLHYTYKGKEKTKELYCRVISGDYAKESIHVSASKVHPTDKKVKQRVAKEYKEAMRIYHSVSSKLYIKKPFRLPLESTITSTFGKARVYNGTLKGYHSGTDFRAKVGTPIVASNDGRVVLVKKRFYSGGTIIIDHGKGIYTCYFHLSNFLVDKGDRVYKNEVIGLSGKSGRVTGPHLHFSARVDGVQVDPLQLIHVMNNTLLKED